MKKLIFGTALLMMMAVTANTYAEGSRSHSPRNETSRNEGWKKSEPGKGEMKNGHHHHHNHGHNHGRK